MMTGQHPPTLPKIVLVHGALHGSWCWERVVPGLERRGYAVTAVDLPGRASKGPPGWRWSLADYVDDLASVVACEPQPVVVVGHSLGGMVISGVAERVPAKLRRMIFLTAFASPDRKNLAELGRQDEGSRLPGTVALSLLRGVVIGKPERMRDVFYHDCDDETFRAVAARLVPESIRTSTGRVAVSPQRFGAVPSTYIVCTGDRALTATMQERMARSIGAETFRLPSSHSPFYSMPEALCDLLHATIARDPGVTRHG